jgi:hypothetical protein
MGAETDKLLYGGGDQVTLLSVNGVDEEFLAKDILLAAEFSMAVLAPGELAENQDVPAFLLTAKGRRNGSKALSAVTIVFEPEMAVALIKALRKKYIEIPIAHRNG